PYLCCACAQPLLNLSLLGDVLQRAEPVLRFGRIGLLRLRLDDLLDVDPRAVGPLQPVFDVDAGSLNGCLDACAPQSLSIVWMEQVEPLARTVRHSRGLDADQRRQRLRPALKDAIGAGNHMAKLCHHLRAAQARLALAQEIARSVALGLGAPPL